MVACEYCGVAKAILKRPKTSEKICQACFFDAFELEVHETIIANDLFARGDRVAIAASGGKDSTVLAHVLTTLNQRYDYGLNLFLLSIDEGITGYRDDSLESVKRNQAEYGIPLQILSYKDLYGWSMDEIVAEIGLKGNCTFCGVFRRQALDRGAVLMKADKIATGHVCDDIAETVLMNLLRGDIARLERCVSITTGKESSLPRCKPFKYSYEKEIVMYAYYKKLDYFSTECIYSPNAYRGFAREFLKDLETVKSRAIIDIVRSAEHFRINQELIGPATAATARSIAHESDALASHAARKKPATATGASNSVASKKLAQSLGVCERCKYISSNRICKACALLEGLNKGKPRVVLDETALQALLTVPNRVEMNNLAPRDTKAPIQIQADDTASPAPPADSSPNTRRDGVATGTGGVSAPMAMATSLNATSW